MEVSIKLARNIIGIATITVACHASDVLGDETQSTPGEVPRVAYQMIVHTQKQMANALGVVLLALNNNFDDLSPSATKRALNSICYFLTSVYCLPVYDAKREQLLARLATVKEALISSAMDYLGGGTFDTRIAELREDVKAARELPVASWTSEEKGGADTAPPCSSTLLMHLQKVANLTLQRLM
jgi:hypothetical protein